MDDKLEMIDRLYLEQHQYEDYFMVCSITEFTEDHHRDRHGRGGISRGVTYHWPKNEANIPSKVTSDTFAEPLIALAYDAGLTELLGTYVPTYLQANKYIKLKKWMLAEQLLSYAAKFDGGNAADLKFKQTSLYEFMLNNYAFVSTHLSNYEAALKALDKLESAAEDYLPLYYNRGSLELKNSNYLEAIDYFGKFLRKLDVHDKDFEMRDLDSYRVYAYVNRAVAHFANHDTLRAVDDLKIAAKLSPDNELIHLNLAKVYYAQSKFDLAKEQYDEAIKLGPKNPSNYRGRAVFLEERRYGKDIKASYRDYLVARQLEQDPIKQQSLDMRLDAIKSADPSVAKLQQSADLLVKQLLEKPTLDELSKKIDFLRENYESLSQAFSRYKEDIEQGLTGLREELKDVFANGVSTNTRFGPNVRVVYDKHRRGYAAMRQTLGFKLLHAVSAPARLLSDAFGSKRSVMMTQSSDDFALTLAEPSTDVTSSSEVNAIDTNRVLSLMPNLSFEETYYTQPELPFDAGAWDPQIDQHPETGAPIFTYRVFEQGEEVGSARFYQHPMLCRSKAGNRHNVLELRGVLDQLDTDTMAAHTDEICASLPPTLIERLGESGTRGVKWGAWRGITGVVEHGMKRRGYSSKASKWVTQGVFYGGLFVSNLYHRVSVKQAQGQELTNEDMLSATTEALVDTGTVFASQQLLTKAGQALHATGEGLTRKGWTKTGGALQTVSGWLGYGMYGAMAYQQGVGAVLAQVAGGAAGEALITHAGTAVVDRVVPAYASPLTASVNSAEAPHVETDMGQTVANPAHDDRFDPVKEGEDSGAGMGLVD